MKNGDLYKKPEGGANMADSKNCNCGCQDTTTTNPDGGYACPPYWPWPPRPDCPPPPPPYPGEWPGRRSDPYDAARDHPCPARCSALGLAIWPVLAGRVAGSGEGRARQ